MSEVQEGQKYAYQSAESLTWTLEELDFGKQVHLKELPAGLELKLFRIATSNSVYWRHFVSLHTPQLIINQQTLEIISISYGKGRRHDMRVFKESQIRLRLSTELLGDSGYQGVKKLHENSRTPHKGWRKRALSKEQRAENRLLSKVRIMVEPVICRLKVFWVLKEVYRNRRRRFGLQVSLIAGLYNADLKVRS